MPSDNERILVEYARGSGGEYVLQPEELSGLQSLRDQQVAISDQQSGQPGLGGPIYQYILNAITDEAGNKRPDVSADAPR